LHYLGLVAHYAKESMSRQWSCFGGRLRWGRIIRFIGVNLAMALQAMGRTDEAVELSREVVAKWPDFAPGHAALGGAMIGAGKPQEALAAATACDRAAE